MLVTLIEPMCYSFWVDMNITLILMIIPLFLDNETKEFELVIKTYKNPSMQIKDI